jgi:phosphoribosylamine--glycine ligase
MRIGLVGSGGREHAIAKVLARNPARDSLYNYASHPNPGIEPLAATTETGDLHNTGSVVDFFLANHIDLVVVGPEAPLLAGVIDALRDRGILAVGPTQSQARIEGDKAFMRDLGGQAHRSDRWKRCKCDGRTPAHPGRCTGSNRDLD